MKGGEKNLSSIQVCEGFDVIREAPFSDEFNDLWEVVKDDDWDEIFLDFEGEW